MKITLEFDSQNELDEYCLLYFQSIKVSARKGKPLDELFFNVRTANIMKSANISTLEQLLTLRPIDILKMPNAGKKTLEDVQEVLNEIGLKLSDE